MTRILGGPHEVDHRPIASTPNIFPDTVDREEDGFKKPFAILIRCELSFFNSAGTYERFPQIIGICVTKFLPYILLFKVQFATDCGLAYQKKIRYEPTIRPSVTVSRKFDSAIHLTG